MSDKNMLIEDASCVHLERLKLSGLDDISGDGYDSSKFKSSSKPRDFVDRS